MLKSFNKPIVGIVVYHVSAAMYLAAAPITDPRANEMIEN